MNSKNKVAIKKEKIGCTCMKCLKEFDDSKLHIIHIPQMGYGSGFDGFDTIVILCEDCYKESIKKNPNLWSMKTAYTLIGSEKNEDEQKISIKENVLTLNESELYIDMEKCCNLDDFEYDYYENEDEMFQYIYSLPVEGRELIYNRLDFGHFAHRKADPQEWIDYEQEELPDELCKKNGWRNITEIKEFKEKHKKDGYVIMRQ